MADGGWIKLYRQIEDCEIWNTPEPYSKRDAWIDLLLTAAHDTQTIVNGKTVITISRGQLLTSQRRLSKKWKWSQKKVGNFFTALEGLKMASLKESPFGTLVTIEKYSFFQGGESAEESLKESQKNHRGITEESQNKKLRREECKELSISPPINIPPLTNSTGEEKTPEKTDKHAVIQDDFPAFWDAYPKKIGKSSAEKAFRKAIQKTSIENILLALDGHMKSRQWQEEDGRYIPYPATWLNQERWDDVLEAAKGRNSSTNELKPTEF